MKLTEEQRAEIIRLRGAGVSATKIADKVGVCEATVFNVMKQAKTKSTQINEEFDAAVDQMIEESKAVPALAQRPEAPAIPPIVLSSIRATVAEKESEVCMKLADIRLMQQQVEQLRSEIAELRTWAEGVGA